MKTSENKSMVVDMTLGNPILSEIPETLLLVEASDHETATRYIQSALKPEELNPGTTNVHKADESRKWWVFGVFL